MHFAAGLLGILFALFHGIPSARLLAEPVAPRGSHQPGAIPFWARVLWVLFAITTLVGSIAYLATRAMASAAVVSVGAVGIWALAIANGFWIHGRPTVSHHLVRAALLAVLLALTFLGLE
ncbi:MAG: hypothetical protein KY429_08540 [Actinobacteria bacterium]|nr:hypothetical protein [Actinomycetota bacterium]